MAPDTDKKDNMSNIGDEFLKKTVQRMISYKQLTETAINQVKDDKKLNYCLDKESNSIAIIIKHLSGNMRSRWTNFLTTDGEKHDRHRPLEFDRQYNPTRKELMELWENGWIIFFDAMQSISSKDLLKIIYIRKEPLTVINAILRQLTHYTSHIGQILFIAKHLEWQNWKHVTLERDVEVFDINAKTI